MSLASNNIGYYEMILYRGLYLISVDIYIQIADYGFRRLKGGDSK